MRTLKFRYWNTITKEMVNNPKMPYKENWTIEQLFEDRGWMWMQFTGLTDRHGIEIYEGDIVAIDMWQGNEHGYIAEDGVIKWHEESSAFKWFSGESSDGNNYWLSQSDEKQREIIGNIHENPELLDEKN